MIAVLMLKLHCRAGPSLSAYNYDSAYGKKALMVMYRGIMEQVSIISSFWCYRTSFPHICSFYAIGSSLIQGCNCCSVFRMLCLLFLPVARLRSQKLFRISLQRQKLLLFPLELSETVFLVLFFFPSIPVTIYIIMWNLLSLVCNQVLITHSVAPLWSFFVNVLIKL